MQLQGDGASYAERQHVRDLASHLGRGELAQRITIEQRQCDPDAAGKQQPLQWRPREGDRDAKQRQQHKADNEGRRRFHFRGASTFSSSASST